MFKKATRKKARLRLAFMGLGGSGKTMTALRVAAALTPAGQRFAFIDTEHGSGELFADSPNPDGGLLDFDYARLDEMRGKFSVGNYIDALQGAASAGYPVVVIDSLSHAWAGEGGILDFVDRNSGANKFSSGWKKATPMQNQLVDAILSYPGHLIVTLRTKAAYVVEQVKGKSVPRKVGLAPVQREGIEYEFSVIGEIDQATHELTITKTRCSALDGRTFPMAGADLAHELKEWLDTGKNWHDETWERDKPRFFMALKDFGADYDAAVAFLASTDPEKRPSQVGSDGRKALLDSMRADATEAGPCDVCGKTGEHKDGCPGAPVEGAA